MLPIIAQDHLQLVRWFHSWRSTWLHRQTRRRSRSIQQREERERTRQTAGRHGERRHRKPSPAHVVPRFGFAFLLLTFLLPNSICSRKQARETCSCAMRYLRSAPDSWGFWPELQGWLALMKRELDWGYIFFSQKLKLARLITTDCIQWEQCPWVNLLPLFLLSLAGVLRARLVPFENCYNTN